VVSKSQQTAPKISNAVYDAELFRLQTELVQTARVGAVFRGPHRGGLRRSRRGRQWRRDIFEQMLIENGLLLRKYRFSVSAEKQLRRFRARLNDPVRQWKLSPMDLESLRRWEDYSRAEDEMMAHTDTPNSPWYVV
jgi:hypothetical protein